MVPGGDVDQVHLPVQGHGHTDPFLDIVAGGVHLAPAHAELDGEAGTHGPPHRLHHLQGETHAVLQAAAPFVLPGIDLRGHELGQEPTMAAMEGDHAEARLLGPGGAAGIVLQGAPDILLVHLGHVAVFVLHLHGAVEGETRVLTGVGEHPRVAQLAGGDAAVPGHPAGQGGKARERMGVLDIEQEAVMAAPLPVHDAVPHADGSEAADGLPLIIGGGLRVGQAVRADVVEALGRGEDAVPEEGISQSDGAEQIRIFHGAGSLRFFPVYTPSPPLGNALRLRA